MSSVLSIQYPPISSFAAVTFTKEVESLEMFNKILEHILARRYLVPSNQTRGNWRFLFSKVLNLQDKFIIMPNKRPVRHLLPINFGWVHRHQDGCQYSAPVRLFSRHISYKLYLFMIFYLIKCICRVNFVNDYISEFE